jgi:hypothetical protein
LVTQAGTGLPPQTARDPWHRAPGPGHRAGAATCWRRAKGAPRKIGNPKEFVPFLASQGRLRRKWCAPGAANAHRRRKGMSIPSPPLPGETVTAQRSSGRGPWPSRASARSARPADRRTPARGFAAILCRGKWACSAPKAHQRALGNVHQLCSALGALRGQLHARGRRKTAFFGPPGGFCNALERHAALLLLARPKRAPPPRAKRAPPAPPTAHRPHAWQYQCTGTAIRLGVPEMTIRYGLGRLTAIPDESVCRRIGALPNVGPLSPETWGVAPRAISRGRTGRHDGSRQSPRARSMRMPRRRSVVTLGQDRLLHRVRAGVAPDRRQGDGS